MNASGNGFSDSLPERHCDPDVLPACLGKKLMGEFTGSSRQETQFFCLKSITPLSATHTSDPGKFVFDMKYPW